jgi:hypothetical protein
MASAFFGHSCSTPGGCGFPLSGLRFSGGFDNNHAHLSQGLDFGATAVIWVRYVCCLTCPGLVLLCPFFFGPRLWVCGVQLSRIVTLLDLGSATVFSPKLDNASFSRLCQTRLRKKSRRRHQTQPPPPVSFAGFDHYSILDLHRWPPP